MLRKLTWLYVAGFLGIFLICHTPGLTDAEGRLLGLFRIDPIDDFVHLHVRAWRAPSSPGAPTHLMPLYFKVIGMLYDLDALVGMTMSRGLLDLSVFTQGPVARRFQPRQLGDQHAAHRARDAGAVDWLPHLAATSRGLRPSRPDSHETMSRDRGWRAAAIGAAGAGATALVRKLVALALIVAAASSGPRARSSSRSATAADAGRRRAWTGSGRRFPARSRGVVHVPHAARMVHRLQRARNTRGSSAARRRARFRISVDRSVLDRVRRRCARSTRPHYPFQTGYHVMLGIIGASFTAENVVKAVYENTVGRATEWLSSHDTPEDRLGRQDGAGVRRVHAHRAVVSSSRSARDWPRCGATHRMWGPHPLRKWERRAALTAEYGFKAAYGWLMGLASGERLRSRRSRRSTRTSTRRR